MSKKIAVAGIGFSILSVILAIVGLATADWLEGCLSFEKFFRRAIAGVGLGESNPATSQILDQSRQTFADLNFCFIAGLFQTGSDVAGGGRSSFSVGLDTQESFVIATAALLIVGIVFLVFGSLASIIGAVSHKCCTTKFAENRLLKIGFAIHVIGMLAFLAAMIVYTVEQNKIINNNPILFLAQLPAVLLSLLRSNLGSLPGISVPPNSFANQSDFGIVDSTPSNVSNYGSYDYSSYEAINYNGGNPVLINLTNTNPGLQGGDLGGNAPGVPEATNNLFESLFVFEFGYSFLLGWAGFACALIACIFNLVILLRQTKQSNTSDEPNPMKHIST